MYFFDKIAILMKLRAKIWFKLLESACNSILHCTGTLTLQVSAKLSEQKFQHTLNIKITTSDGIQRLDRSSHLNHNKQAKATC